MAEYVAQVEARLDYVRLYADVQKAKPSGDGWMTGLCPFHEDHNASFGFNTRTGRWKCHAGCGQGSIYDYRMRQTGQPYITVLRELGENIGLQLPAPRTSSRHSVCYSYHDEEGTLVFQVVRGPGKKFFQRRPDGNGGWINDLKGVHRVLYKLPELLARAGETVYVVEGEKDADRLDVGGLLATTNSGGAGKWQRSYSEHLRGRDVVILPDNDGPGRDHALGVAKSLTGIAASVKIVELPGLPEKGDVSDWLDAGHVPKELLDLVAAAPPWEPDKEVAGSQPKIITNGRQLVDVFKDTWGALLAGNDPPHLFTFAGKLARVMPDRNAPSIQLLTEAAAYGLLVRHAAWFQEKENGLVHAKPPREVANDILINPHPGLPVLEGVVTTPVFDGRWRLLAAPGYHQDACLWLHLSEAADAYDVPVQPSAEDLAAARALILDDLLVDFPFTAESDLAHAVAALLLPFTRRMFDGPTPLHLIEAPIAGSGKSLLADLISIVARGRPCDATTVDKDEAETRKKITTLLSTAPDVVLIDNVRDGLDSAQLAAALTAEVWSDRLLGQTLQVRFPNKVTWLVTANNPSLSLELVRRSLRIRINPAQEQPWRRTGFKHDPIREWAKRNRTALVRAILVIIRSWIATGAPRCDQTLGSFEEWSRTIGGIVGHLGLPGFLGDADEFYAAADSDSGEWAALVAAWWARHRDAPVGVRELLELAEANDLVGFACAGQSDAARKAKFGKALGTLRDRKFGELEIVVGQDGHAKKRSYRLRRSVGELFGAGGQHE